ncbi:MAG: glycoside hydrolase family 2 TIM barrel-domain containing protein [Candidatus Hadarchaeales archaeon]
MKSKIAVLGAVLGIFLAIVFGVELACGLQVGTSTPTLNGLAKPQSTGPVRFSGNQLLVNGQSFIMKGVGYSPIPIGSGWAFDFYGKPEIYNRDFLALRVMGCNTIRTWTNVTSREFLDAAYNEGDHPIYVIMGFTINPSLDLSSSTVREHYISEFRDYVSRYKDHPAVLMWAIGNEVNLQVNGNDNLRAWYSLLNEMARAAYEVEGSNYHPVTTSNGELATIGDSSLGSDDASMDYLDAWGIAVYQGGTDFVGVFSAYQSKSSKPVWVSEYGIDAWDEISGQEDEDTQAFYDASLWDSIQDYYNRGITFGGSLMSYSDEWYKCGNSSSHDTGGYDFPSSPDGFLNEEWWGIMKILDNGSGPDVIVPRKVYSELRDRWGGISSSPVLRYGRAIVDNRGGPLTFTFLVTYSDLDDDAPEYIRVQVNGSTYDMTEENPSDTRYADGKTYAVSVDLPPGAYSYHFEASDGVNVIVSEELSTSGSLRGGPSPIVPVLVAVGIVAALALLWYLGVLQKILFKSTASRARPGAKTRR